MGSTEKWAARRETVSETVPPAERVGACHSVGICGELLPDVALVGAVCDLAWSRTWPEVFSWYAGVEGNLVYLPSSPSLTLVGRQSENDPDDCLRIRSSAAPASCMSHHCYHSRFGWYMGAAFPGGIRLRRGTRADSVHNQHISDGFRG